MTEVSGLVQSSTLFRLLIAYLKYKEVMVVADLRNQDKTALESL